MFKPTYQLSHHNIQDTDVQTNVSLRYMGL